MATSSATKFCGKCGNLFIPKLLEGKLHFSCRLCNYTELATADNYIISAISSSIEKRRIELSADSIIEDITNPRIREHCNKCKKETIKVYVVEPDSLKKIIYCSICKT